MGRIQSVFNRVYQRGKSLYSRCSALFSESRRISPVKDLSIAQYIDQCAAVVFRAAAANRLKGQRFAVGCENRGDSFVVDRLDSGPHNSNDGHSRDALALGAPGDAHRYLAAQTLAVHPSLAGQHQITAGEQLIESDQIQHHFNARAQTCTADGSRAPTCPGEEQEQR